MAIAFVQQASNGIQGGSGLNGMNVTFASSVTTGNLIVVIVRARSGNSGSPDNITGVSDGTNTYSLIASDNSQDPGMWCFVAQNVTGGSITVTVSASVFSGNDYAWIWIGEYSGCATSSAVDASASGAFPGGSGATDLTSSSITTTGSNEAIVLGVSQNNFGTYTAGSNFTIRNGSIYLGSSFFGGVEDYITTSTLSSFTAHITSTVTNEYTMVWVALKPAGGSGGTTTVFSISAGTYSVSGKTDSVSISFKASASSYTVTGKTETYRLAFDAVKGTYVVSKLSSPLAVGFHTNSGSYSVSGKSMTYRQGMTAGPGSYRINGQAASFIPVPSSPTGVFAAGMFSSFARFGHGGADTNAS